MFNLKGLQTATKSDLQPYTERKRTYPTDFNQRLLSIFG